MKKVLCIAIAGIMTTAAAFACNTCGCTAKASAEPGNIGIGFQGIIPGLVLGDIFNGVAVRGKPAPVGWQVEVIQGKIDDSGGVGPLSGDAELTVVKGKAYLALVERKNSVFYAGASAGYWVGELGSIDVDGWSIAPLVGAEWNFSDLPELGFNMEASYEIDQLELDNGSTVDLDISGVTISTGIIYYF